MSRIDESIAFIPVRIAVMTVSDTRDATNDTSGDTLVKRIEEAGHILGRAHHLQRRPAANRRPTGKWIADPQIDVVISTGGTGLTGRDVTVEAFHSVFEKEIDELPEHLPPNFLREDRHLHLAIACLRGRAKGNHLLFARLWTKAVKDGWDDILKWQLDNRHRPCNSS